MEEMVGMMKKHASHWWWLDSHHNAKKSPWLQSTLSELDEKTEALLKLIDEDADSFAQRAEMYYKKRPELISVVEDFYRAHRSLAERYDQIKSESTTRLLTSLGSPFTSPRSSTSTFSPSKHCQEKSVHSIDQNYVSYSENFDHEDSADSEVEDPEEEVTRDGDVLNWVSDEELRRFKEEIDGLREERQLSLKKLEEMQSVFSTDEVRKLKEEIDRLREENATQKFCMMQKDEEMKLVMRQLSLSKEAAAKSQVRNDEIMKLKEEIETMKDEIRRQNEQIMQKDKENRDVMMQLGLLQKKERSSRVFEDEVWKLKEEMKRLQDEVNRQKDQIRQTIEDKEEVIRGLGVAREVNSRVLNNDVQKLKREINRLEEQNMTQEYQLLQKDEEKREVIRQLGMAVDVLKEENSMLRKYVMRDGKKRSPFEFHSFVRRLFNGSSRSQSSVAAL